MEKTIYSDFYGKRDPFTFKYPEVSECPLCRKGIQPILLSSMGYQAKNGRISLYLLNTCPLCDGVFTSVYSAPSASASRINDAFYRNSYPQRPYPIRFEKGIETISNSFVTIYQQAYAAEQNQLDQIAGIGYRRALEFLVKDYCIFRYPDFEEKIKNQPLSQCINQYIDYPRLKTVAERAAWLGNDQTHYVQKHTDKDLEDLKRLITLTMHWIIIELGVDEAEAIERK